MPPRILKSPAEPAEPAALLPDRFQAWFAARGWSPREHQLALLEKAREDRSALLIAPTGAGKTLAGFLPTLVELSMQTVEPTTGAKQSLVSTGRTLQRSGGLHTLYISPLKALAVDIARNLERPVAEMALPIKIETRTGDTPTSRRQRQRRYPPDILLTTPEQLALLLSSDDAPFLFSSLKRIVLDELHALVTSKRGDLLSLGLARLWRLAPQMRAIGLSATVAEPESLARFLVPQPGGKEAAAEIVIAGGAAPPLVEMMDTRERLPWAGHSARHALPEIYELIKANKTTLVFVNTRSQAEMLFQNLWSMNDDNLAIALHHGSLDVAQRRKVEDAMSAGKLRGVVCTSSLDLGVDWGDVDLVVNIGAPKGSSRLMQRIGRANHRLDEASRAVLVPANRFEVLECRVAIDAVAENAQDTPPLRTGALDVLAQHVLGCACGEPFLSEDLYDEVRTAAPYADLTRQDFDDVVDFVASGGYALKTYERFARIKQDKQGRWRVANPKGAAELPDECRHHRRGRHAEGAAGAIARRRPRRRSGKSRRVNGRDRPRRQAARRDRGSLHRGPQSGRHFRVQRRGGALRDPGRGPGLRLARQRQGPESAVLYGRQVSALDLSCRTRASPAR
ncbi:Lhr-like helicase [Bradyrhizobium sp. LM6.10]